MSVIAETNTLNQSDTLNFTGRLVSNNKNFTLGFIKPVTYINNTYLAIWNSKYRSPSSPVWIANRDTPITNGSDATLFIDKTAKFVINRTHGHPIQLCPGETTTDNTTNTRAVLLDNGNLVLTEVNSDGSVGRTLWQSFDCPTDTLLPGMKLGVNHRTGRNWTLTSWPASNDPSPGAFTLEWDPHGLELVLRRRGAVFWTSGALKNLSDPDGGMTFGNRGPARHQTHSYKMMYTRTPNEEFFNYTLKDDRLDTVVHKSIDWIIDYKGRFSFENNGVQLQEYCYGYKTKDDEGCAEWEQPQCRSYNTTFQLLSGYFMNKSNGNSIDGDLQRIGPADCRVSCWDDCECLAYQKMDTLRCVQYHQEAEFRPNPSGNSEQLYVIQQPENGKFAI
ncbi:G-type lectin S-receptor-like serine/threonine-protein kinase CES101 [Neltuma alba]|uniref:G-type lectin S-receptor-like serine/threonine-protein kinase CES101 n=1 Tax=Neltuma alba TaxID=207710 RepID=UPI0010A5449A|nr:G-type lectin S-receptor-like serine/threonine-protein kinase CES101 [Prosopis alba]